MRTKRTKSQPYSSWWSTHAAQMGMHNWCTTFEKTKTKTKTGPSSLLLMGGLSIIQKKFGNTLSFFFFNTNKIKFCFIIYSIFSEWMIVWLYTLKEMSLVALIMRLSCTDFKIWKLVDSNYKLYVFTCFFYCCYQYMNFSFY